MSRLPILLFSAIALFSFSACTQTQDIKPDVEIAEDGKLDMEALLKEAKEKRDASAAELAKEKAQTEILQEFVDIAEKPTVIKTEDGKLDLAAMLEVQKAEGNNTAEDVAREKAETAQEKAETEALNRIIDILED